MKVAAFYLVGTLALTVYGGEVCPFLEQLTLGELAAALTVSFAIAGSARWAVTGVLQRREARTGVDLRRPWRILRVDLASWILAGLLVTGWNALNYDFPVSSGLKVVLGCATLGIFSATYLALEAERDLVLCLARQQKLETLRSGGFFSITTKFFLFVASALSVVLGVILLLVYKDFDFVIEALRNSRSPQFGAVVVEISFVFAVLLTGSLVVARKYGSNLRLMFELQLKAFDAVEHGNYDAFVPVVSRDEFSLIAEKTNHMIDGLRERERIKRAFGKYMSPTVAEAVLGSEEETRLGGWQLEAAVLFSDLRDFTPMSERCTPQETVNILNAYFTMVVKAVHRHGGVLDKFVGDAALAVFGLAECENPSEDALRATLEIQRGLEELNRRFEAEGYPRVRNGNGIHFGPVVAGNIGSEERLEYTVIGDAVNTASRLQDLTKEIPSTVAVSGETYERVGTQTRSELQYVGSCALKGKSEAVPVYGLTREVLAAGDEHSREDSPGGQA